MFGKSGSVGVLEGAVFFFLEVQRRCGMSVRCREKRRGRGHGAEINPSPFIQPVLVYRRCHRREAGVPVRTSDFSGGAQT